jgi:hypothetical protein
MVKTQRGPRERQPGRPGVKGGGTVVGLRVSPEFLARVDQWRAAQPGVPTRPQAIIRLAERGLGRQR